MQDYSSGCMHLEPKEGRAVYTAPVLAARKLEIFHGSLVTAGPACSCSIGATLRRMVGGCDGRNHRDPAPGTSKYRKVAPCNGTGADCLRSRRTSGLRGFWSNYRIL